MADERNPNDRYRFNLTDEGIRRQTRVDDELQADPELAEGPASSGRVAMYAIAIAVIVGALFYGMNNTPIERPAHPRPPRTPRRPEHRADTVSCGASGYA